MTHGAELEPAFCGCWCWLQMCVDEIRCEEWNVVKESEVCCAEKSLHWGAEKGLVHELHPIAEVGHGVHIVDGVLVSRASSVCGGCGGEREAPQACYWVACSSEEVSLSIKNVTSVRVVGDGVSGITEYSGGE